MKKIFSVFLAALSFFSTQSFASSIQVEELQKLTKPAETAREGTATCRSNRL